MKKRTLLLTLILLLSTAYNSTAQVAFSTESKGDSNLYFQALSLYLQKTPRQPKILVEENTLTTECLPKELGGTSIELISFKNIKRHLKKRKSVIDLIRIVPLRFDSGKFYINIINYKVSKKRKKYDFVNIGGMQCEFVYDCSTNCFNLIKR